jgi:F0F1-type ATP synthase assembly protein I
MAVGGDDPRKFGLYLALGQAGLEMVAPLGLGLFLDRMLGWTPWLTLCGAVGGFIGGLAHMIILAHRLNQNDGKNGSPPPSNEGRPT